MRNWNVPSWPRTPTPTKFSAYLWGIETSSESPLVITALRFQPTYEELKPFVTTALPLFTVSFQPTYEELKLSVLAFISAGVVRFQPTYEELKPKFASPSTFPVPCFQPTYEELKPWSSVSVSEGRGVFSLPMRNWNSLTNSILYLGIL